MNRILTCIGDANNPGTWSGTPYFLVDAGKRGAFLTGGWSLYPERLKNRRLLWNAGKLISTSRYGGYQYTSDFCRRLLQQAPQLQETDEIISTFPVFPDVSHVNCRVNYYIDATLTQLFTEYGKGSLVNPQVQVDAIARERSQYAAAGNICCMSQWAAQSVVSDYGIPASDVHVVGGGANLEAGATELLLRNSDVHKPLRLGFVGKDWRRKGLNILLEVATFLEAMGVPAQVVAIGFDPASGPNHRLLSAQGFIDKRREPKRFAEFLRSCDFGCLFSSAEAFGLSNLEFMRLGVPVITYANGGMADTVPDGCGHIFPGDEGAEHIAQWIAQAVTENGIYERLCETLAKDPLRFTWDAVVKRMHAVWAGSKEHSLARHADA